MTTDPAFGQFAQFAPPIRQADALRAAITAAYRTPEQSCVPPLAVAASVTAPERAAIAATARALIERLRAGKRAGGVQALVQEFALSSR